MLEGSVDKKCKGVTKNVTKEIFNSMTTENACLAGRKTSKNECHMKSLS